MSAYYQDEHVTLYLGDCIAEHREWLGADVLVTDPPYGIAWRGGGMNGARRKQEIKTVSGDHNADIRDAALEAWGEGPCLVFGSWRTERPRNVQHRLIWHKLGRNPGPANAPWYAVDEEIYVIGKGFDGKSHPTVYQTTENRANEPRLIGHPTPKPVGLMELLVEKCPPGIIADPFAGSGATLLAAKNLGRKAIGVELEEKYCELIAKRCAQDVFDFGSAA